MTKLLTIFTYIVVAITSFLLGYNYYPYYHKSNTTKSNTTNQDNKLTMDNSTTVSAHEKETLDEPDLVLDNIYTAKVNGETVTVPVIHKTPDNPSKGTTAVVKNELDLTPVIHKVAESEYKRNWEVGMGLGVSHDGDLYAPVSLQRNYNFDRALEVQIGFGKDRIENTQVVYKWKF